MKRFRESVVLMLVSCLRLAVLGYMFRKQNVWLEKSEWGSKHIIQ